MVTKQLVWHCKLSMGNVPVCLPVTDIFTTRRRVTHVKYVFRGLVGNRGNWRSVLKIDYNFNFNKNSVCNRN